LYRVDLKTGNAKEVYEFDPSKHPAGMYALSPDDQFIYHASYASNTGVERSVDRILEVHLQTGAQRQVCTIPASVGPVGLQLSPDGRTLAIRRSLSEPKASIDLVEVDGRDYRALHQLERRGNWSDPLGWSNDSRWVLFSVPEQQASVMRVPVEGGKAEKWLPLDAKGMVQYFNLSPDGTRLAFSALKRIQERWAIDNIVSVLK
jgi:Tol biopolymer transport system component